MVRLADNIHWIATTPDHMILNHAEEHMKNAEAFMQAYKPQARDELLKADALLQVVLDFEHLRGFEYRDGEQARRCVDLRIRWHELERQYYH